MNDSSSWPPMRPMSELPHPRDREHRSAILVKIARPGPNSSGPIAIARWRKNRPHEVGTHYGCWAIERSAGYYAHDETFSGWWPLPEAS